MSILKLKDELGAWQDIPSIKGETGDAAGFGTATASVDTGTGTPSCVVTLSGEDTAKNFDFAFHNLMYDDSDLQSDFADLADDFDVLQGQFDTAVAALTVDSEVADIRVGANGTTYTSAGAAVRGQVSDLTSALSDVAPIGAETAAPFYRQTENYKITDAGLYAYDADYSIRYVSVSAGTWVHVISNHKFQFSPTDSVPGSAPSNRIGGTYGEGEFWLCAPTGTNYIAYSAKKTDRAFKINTVAYSKMATESDVVGSLKDIIANDYDMVARCSYADGNFVSGYWNSGSVVTNASWATGPCYKVKKGDLVVLENINPEFQITYNVRTGYGDVGDYLYKYSWDYLPNYAVLRVPDDGYFLFIIRKDPLGSFDPSTFMGTVTVYTDSKFAKVSEDINDAGGWVVGTIDSSAQGADYTQNNRGRTQLYISVNTETKIVITPSNSGGFAFVAHWYAKDGSYLGYSDNYWFTATAKDETVILPIYANAAYVRIVCRFTGDPVVTESDLETFRNSVFVYNMTAVDDACRNANITIENENFRSLNHRGYSLVAPENTLPAYRLSKEKGFKYVETDVSWTSDDVAVLLHDGTINRTARNANGTTISETIKINEITYEDVLDYDFGIWKGAEYAGTKIPTFEQFIALCKRLGLHPVIEIKAITDGATPPTHEQIDGLIETVGKYNMLDRVTWTSFGDAQLTYMRTKLPNARLGFACVAITENIVNYVSGLKRTGDAYIASGGTFSDGEMALCQEAGIEVEAWTIDKVDDLLDLPSYISGITSDWINAAKVFYENEI